MAVRIGIEEVLDIHKELVRMFADEDPIEPNGPRDRGLIESALGRPFTGAAGQEKYTTVDAKAAALFHSLVKNHGFHNGNKRTALVTMLVFLDRNNHRLDLNVTDDELFEFVTRVAANEFPTAGHGLHVDSVVEHMTSWLRDRATARASSTSEMSTADFTKSVIAVGGRVTDGGASWCVFGLNNKSIRIGKDTKKLNGSVVRSYVKKLGLSSSRTGVYIDEFQEGVPAPAVALLRFRNILKRLANA